MSLLNLTRRQMNLRACRYAKRAENSNKSARGFLRRGDLLEALDQLDLAIEALRDAKAAALGYMNAAERESE